MRQVAARRWIGVALGLALALVLLALVAPSFRPPELRYAVCVVEPGNPRPCPPDGGQAVVGRWGHSWYVGTFDHQVGGWWIASRGMWFHTPADEWLWPHEVQRWACEADRAVGLRFEGTPVRSRPGC